MLMLLEVGHLNITEGFKDIFFTVLFRLDFDK